MGESLITRFGGSSSDPNTPKAKWILCTEIITENKEWTVPLNIRNGEVSVRIFGGGGGSSGSAGGGGGYMNNGIINGLAGGSTISINIVSGGSSSHLDSSNVWITNYAETGGTTFFWNLFECKWWYWRYFY